MCVKLEDQLAAALHQPIFDLSEMLAPASLMGFKGKEFAVRWKYSLKTPCDEFPMSMIISFDFQGWPGRLMPFSAARKLPYNAREIFFRIEQRPSPAKEKPEALSGFSWWLVAAPGGNPYSPKDSSSAMKCSQRNAHSS